MSEYIKSDEFKQDFKSLIEGMKKIGKELENLNHRNAINDMKKI